MLKDESSHRLGGFAIKKLTRCCGQGSSLARVTKFAKLSARAVRLSRYRIGPRSKGIGGSELHPDVSTYWRYTNFATGTLGIPPFLTGNVSKEAYYVSVDTDHICVYTSIYINMYMLLCYMLVIFLNLSTIF